jgi:hypothetical protein
VAVSEFGQRSRDEISVPVGGNIARSNRVRHTQGIINPKFDISGILCDGMSEFECPHPECEDSDKTFRSERGMKVHHKHVHDESLAKKEVECQNCESKFTYYPKYKARYSM